MLPNGVHIPEGVGTHLQVPTLPITTNGAPQVCNRDKAARGEDADELVPERWLEHRAVASGISNFTWGHGPSMCLVSWKADRRA